MKKSNKIPKYNFGGKLEKGLKDYALGVADSTLGVVGLDNVVKDDQYSDTGFGNFAKKTSNITGAIGKAALPIAANIVAPGSGKFVSMGQQAIGQFNPQDPSQFDAQGNPIDPNMQTAKQAIGMAGQIGGQFFAMGGMNNIPNAIPQYPNGGKILKLKPRDFKAEKAHYEEQTRGANQADGSGISSAELAYRYSKLIDPTGATSAVEIGKNFYNGNPQDPIDYLGLVRVPFVSQGMKPLSKLAKQGNKASVLINTITKTNDVAESFRAGGMMGDKYGNGGAVPREFANSEVELEENTLNPDGSTTQFNGPSHEAGGIPTNLDKGTMIFSDKLKHNGKTFAHLNKVNMTHKEDKILDDKKSNNISKLTANLMKQAKNKSSEQLFEKQESLKQERVEKYIKRLGGIMKYPNGGITPIQYKQAQADSAIIYKSGLSKIPNWQYPGFTDAAMREGSRINPNAPFIKTSNGQEYGSDGGKNMMMSENSNFNNFKPTMAPYKQTQIPADNNGIEKVESYAQPIGKPVNHPVYNQYIPGINQSKQRVIKEEFRKGGKKSGFTPMVNDPNEEVTVPGNYKSDNDFSGVLAPSAYDKQMDITDANTLNNSAWEADYMNNPNAPKPSNTSDTTSNKFDWKGLGTQALSFAANNAGNLYDLKRSNENETRKYERMTANLLDPTAALRDAEAQTRRAEYNVRGASGGNAGTYLSNRVALNTQNTINKARINTDYQNANAGIKNEVGKINTGIANEEILANAKIRANQRNIKQSAIASTGSNVANQMNDIRNTEMDKKRIDNLIKMYPSLSKDPEMLKYLTSFK